MELQILREVSPDIAKSWVIQNLFGVSSESVERYPTIQAYCQYLESSFGELLSENYAKVWPMTKCKSPQKASDCWSWLATVLKAAESQGKQASIDDIWQELSKLVSTQDTQQHEGKEYACIAIFAVFCWVTMTLAPALHFELGSKNVYLGCHLKNFSDEPPQQKMDRCRRPITAIFRYFKTYAWALPANLGTMTDGLEGQYLYEASLNYYALNQFGKITICWVDTVSDHLRFNASSRVLMLFRFPTFCVLRSMQKDPSSPLLDSVFHELDPLGPGSTAISQITLDQEIMLSYRVLFGSSTRSRKLANQELNRLKHDCQFFDGLLTALCTYKYKGKLLLWSNHDRTLENLPASVWPKSCRDSDGFLLESDVYSISGDFPRFGHRLLELQNFNLRQRPSKLTDLWRDRRNPLQWYTFWVVLLVGGIGLIVALLQLVVGIMQLVRGW